MAHFAELNSDNIVTRVLVLDNDMITVDGMEVESQGVQILTDLHGGTWKQTSYNASFRKNFAIL